MKSATQRSEVQIRYATAAHKRENALCCPVEYDPKWLEVIPQEVIEKDYGCGDPSKWLNTGETVLDLGSGTGKICFIAAQIVGPEGRVIGIDMTPDMLEVARRNAPIVAKLIGFENVEFRKGRIQDLQLDLEAFDAAIKGNIISHIDYLSLHDLANSLRMKEPLLEDDSVDVVVSNCVLNLVANSEKPALFRELFRALKNGGRVVISDIVSDQPVTSQLQADPALWSGCISGSMTESDFLKAFSDAGFHGIEFVKFESKPWQIVEGIEFRSVTVRAFKGKEGECHFGGHNAIYLGPFSEASDDHGHRFPRGERVPVCEKTFSLLKQNPYAKSFALFSPNGESVMGYKPHVCSQTQLPIRSARTHRHGCR